MAFGSTQSVMSRGAYVAGTYRFPIFVERFSDCLLQWRQWAAVGSVSAINIYDTAERDGFELGAVDKLASKLNPATNKRWSTTPIAFLTLPAAAIASESLPFCPPAPWLLLEIVVGVSVTDFELVFWGKGEI